MLIDGSSGGYGTTGTEWAESHRYWRQGEAESGQAARVGNLRLSARSNSRGVVDYGVKGKTV